MFKIAIIKEQVKISKNLYKFNIYKNEFLKINSEFCILHISISLPQNLWQSIIFKICENSDTYIPTGDRGFQLAPLKPSV